MPVSGFLKNPLIWLSEIETAKFVLTAGGVVAPEIGALVSTFDVTETEAVVAPSGVMLAEWDPPSKVRALRRFAALIMSQSQTR